MNVKTYIPTYDRLGPPDQKKHKPKNHIDWGRWIQSIGWAWAVAVNVVWVAGRARAALGFGHQQIVPMSWTIDHRFRPPPAIKKSVARRIEINVQNKQGVQKSEKLKQASRNRRPTAGAAIRTVLVWEKLIRAWKRSDNSAFLWILIEIPLCQRRTRDDDWPDEQHLEYQREYVVKIDQALGCIGVWRDWCFIQMLPSWLFGCWC